MPSESRPIYYYRNKILKNEDLTHQTQARRLQKAMQNTTTDILIDLSDYILDQNFIDNFAENLQFPFLYKNLICSYTVSILIKSEQLLRLNHQLKPYFKILVSMTNMRDFGFFLKQKFDHFDNLEILLTPQTMTDLKELLSVKDSNPHFTYFWDFKPYNPNIRYSLTIKDIASLQRKHKFIRKKGLEVWNTEIPSQYELESLASVTWQFKTNNPTPQISVIIPTYNCARFLSNVIRHLCEQNYSADSFEIIIVDDGSTDNSQNIIFDIFQSYKNKLNLKYIYWSKSNKDRGDQFFFRAGLARNIGVHHSTAPLIVFLDSDIIVPTDFISLATTLLLTNDVIQFQRLHIFQNKSDLYPNYKNINIKNDTYIEDENYWNQLFKTSHWMSLADHWKYTCTYALGLHKKDFFQVGRFKKYYVSYGFEDTDLGYELHLLNKKFHLEQKPLFHLTSYNQMQYQNSHIKRLKLLRTTASLFYLQHLDNHVYEMFGNFFHFQKPISSYIRDLFKK